VSTIAAIAGAGPVGQYFLWASQCGLVLLHFGLVAMSAANEAETIL